MKSRTAKLVTAAVIVAALVISLSHFNETVVKAVEFEEITQAMQQVPWFHAKGTGFERQVSGVAEQWIGFEPKIHASKWADRHASFASEIDHKQYEYDPNSNTITVRYLETFPIDAASPTVLLTSILQRFERQGAQIVARMGSYQGRKVQVQDITLRNVEGRGELQSLTLYVVSDSKLLYAAEVKAVDAAGKEVMAGTITFDYPPSGPQSIYDLGAPRDAKIVSNMPGLNVHRTRERYRQVWGETSKEYGVMERYWQVRDEATREYIAVIAHNTAVNITDAMNMIDVDYKSGTKHRQERHFVFEAGQVINDEVWAESKQQLGSTFESLLAWSRGHHAGQGRIDLYDGQYDCSIAREHGNWGRPTKYYHPEGSIAPEIALGNLAWPEVFPPARIIEDDYATEHGLICFERLQQGLIYNGKISPPGRFLYYLDPARSYLCHRKVTEWRPDAEWQEDKDWLNGVEPGKVRNGSITVYEIAAAFQAPNGHWYPETIIVQGSGIRKDYRQAPLRTDTIRRVYLNLSPEFPDGIFDIEKLPDR